MVKNTEKNIVSYVNRLIKLVGAPKTSTIDSWELAQMIKDLGFNLRLCVNVTDHVMKNGYSKIEGLFERIEHFNPDQVTFRKMWKGEVKCAESQWIEENCTKSDELLSQIQQHICTYGRKLEYGAEQWSFNGWSTVIDSDSMAKDTDNTAIKYYIIRQDGKMYSDWDSKASLIF